MYKLNKMLWVFVILCIYTWYLSCLYLKHYQFFLMKNITWHLCFVGTLTQLPRWQMMSLCFPAHITRLRYWILQGNNFPVVYLIVWLCWYHWFVSINRVNSTWSGQWINDNASIQTGNCLILWHWWGKHILFKVIKKLKAMCTCAVFSISRESHPVTVKWYEFCAEQLCAGVAAGGCVMLWW